MRNLKPLLIAILTVSTLNGFTQSKSEMTLYVYPPRVDLNWGSPKKLLGSFLGITVGKFLSSGAEVESVSDFGETFGINSQYRSTMGHTIAHIQCQLTNGKTFDRWTSFSGQDFTEVDKKNMLQDKLGMGTLFYDYRDGHIISGDENKLRLIYYKARKHKTARGTRESGKPKYMTFKISSEKCDNIHEMVSFYEGFHFNAKSTSISQLEAKSDQNVLFFTVNLDPYDSFVARKKDASARVGGGCAPYGAALVKMAGYFDASFEKLWRREIMISEKLIGGIPDGNSGELRRIPLKEILFGSLGNSWDYSSEGYKNRPMVIYDPALIWNFVGDVQFCLENSTSVDCPPLVKQWMKDQKVTISMGKVKTMSDVRDFEKYETDMKGHIRKVTRTEKTRVDISGIELK